jgi:hypothetical protein
MDGILFNFRFSSLRLSPARPTAVGVSPRAEFPKAAPYSPPYRLALVKPEWSVGQNMVNPA